MAGTEGDNRTHSRLNVVVGVTGGIAAYKTVNVVRSLILAGHDVHVVATEAALRFVGRPTLEAISRNPVHTDLYEGVAEVRHVAIGQSADVILIAPCTANTLAKLAAGLADDLLGNTVLASAAPLVIAPAMHTEMWQNAATVANVATLTARGVIIVGPGVGQLTGSDVGPGRMEEPGNIVAATLAAVGAAWGRAGVGGGDLAGRRILVTAGGTREPLDPVRFIGNRSSGRQGIALAEAARTRGAAVTLVAANLETAPPAGVSVRKVGSAQDLARVMAEIAGDFDVVVMAAAVADYRPAVIQEAKIKKDDVGERLSLDLVRNPDILAMITADRVPGQTIVGFAAETEADPSVLLELARAKLHRKKCDFLIVNRVGWHQGFSSEDNEIMVLDQAGSVVLETAGTKMSVANRILNLLPAEEK